MRKFFSAYDGFACLLAAVLAVAMPGAHSVQAAAGSSPAKLLSAQLPDGVSLSKASVAETAKALTAAITEHPDLAVPLTEAALRAKTPKRGQGQLSCESVAKIVKSGVGAAPRDSSEIVQTALSTHPDCADSLNALVVSAASNAPDGFVNPTDQYGGFGVGFGPGFPGSPGFTGSPPSGAIALPPGAVTTTLNI